MANSITITRSKTADLRLNIDGKEVAIPFPVSSLTGYRNFTEIFQKYAGLSEEATKAQDGKLTAQEAAGTLDKTLELITSVRGAVRSAIGTEAYNEHLQAVEDDVPFPAWLEMLATIVKGYSEYFHKELGTEGKA
jgi:hypothetical protein